MLQTWLLMRGQIFAVDFLDAVRIIMPSPLFVIKYIIEIYF
jgi:hypothetical protein